MDYKKTAKISSVMLQWGIVVFIITTVLLPESLRDIRIVEIIKKTSEYTCLIGFVLFLLVRNRQIIRGNMVKVWVESTKFSKIDGQHGRWLEFPAHSIPLVHEKVRVEHKDLEGGYAFLRITDKQYIFINNNELKCVKLYCLV